MKWTTPVPLRPTPDGLPGFPLIALPEIVKRIIEAVASTTQK